MSFRSLAEQSQRILVATVTAANLYIGELQAGMNAWAFVCSTLSRELDRSQTETAAAVKMVARLELENLSLREQLRRLQAGTDPEDPPPQSEPMVRQNGYMGHADRPE